MSCERCDDNHWYVVRLENKISALHEELRQERRKTEEFESVKQKRDELQKSADRAYDSWATNPRRGTSDNGEY